MVKGLDIWKDYFKENVDNYVLIGGAACHWYEEEFGLTPRNTRDLDIILIVEALSTEFGMRFWDFIKAGNYASRQRGKRKHEYYRFTSPENSSFPYQVELFSRQIGKLALPEDAHLEPIHIEDGISSLSAILMDDAYYQFTIEHSRVYEGIHIANTEALICLKAKAYIDMLDRMNEGEIIGIDKIEKHKKDVIRLTAMIPGDASFELPEPLKKDFTIFCDLAQTKLPNRDFMKSIGLRNVEAEVLFASLKRYMNI